MTMANAIGDQTRYVELRYEGERVIQGTLLRYSDVAEFPWGDKERFEPGCFGDVSQVDFILDKQHDRGRSLARTGSGGGVTLTDTPQRLELRAELPNTTDANDTLELVRTKVLRGLSVTFRPIEHRLEINKDASVTIIHKRAELRGGGVVDRPQYKGSTLREQIRSFVDMTDEQIRALVAELLEKQRATGNVDQMPANVAELVAAEMKRQMEGMDLGTTIATAVTTSVESALQKRDEAQAAAAAAAEEERMGMMNGKKKKDGKMMEDDDDEKDMAEVADTRAELIMSVKPLLPSDFETRGKTNHEILVAAAGEEVERAAERSEEYLLAKVEGIMERRAAVGNKPGGTQTQTTNPNNGGVAIEEARILGNPTADVNREFARMRTNSSK